MYENNIAEQSGLSFTTEPTHDAIGNRFLGNVSIDSTYGAIPHDKDTGRMSVDTLFKDHISIHSRYLGFYSRGTRNTRCEQCSIIDGQSSGFAVDESSGVPHTPPQSTFLINTLVHGGPPILRIISTRPCWMTGVQIMEQLSLSMVQRSPRLPRIQGLPTKSSAVLINWEAVEYGYRQARHFSKAKAKTPPTSAPMYCMPMKTGRSPPSRYGTPKPANSPVVPSFQESTTNQENPASTSTSA